MSEKVVPIRPPVVAEWNIKMRMRFALGAGNTFEFDLPEMAMTPNSAEQMVQAFREAVGRAATGGLNVVEE